MENVALVAFDRFTDDDLFLAEGIRTSARNRSRSPVTVCYSRTMRHTS
jgi:hypothetical protein